MPVQRSDAVENRARIVAAAKQALAERDDVHLNAIARLAGVGQGTLYRHFANREALLVEVYRVEVEDLIAEAPRLLAAHEPLDALRRWFDRLAAYARVKRGVFEAVQATTSAAAYAEHSADLAGAVQLLLDAGARAGVLREDVDATDVILLVGFLSRVDEAEWDARAPHVLELVTDGLRPRRDPQVQHPA